jgi:hypothetical protein
MSGCAHLHQALRFCSSLFSHHRASTLSQCEDQLSNHNCLKPTKHLQLFFVLSHETPPNSVRTLKALRAKEVNLHRHISRTTSDAYLMRTSRNNDQKQRFEYFSGYIFGFPFPFGCLPSSLYRHNELHPGELRSGRCWTIKMSTEIRIRCLLTATLMLHRFSNQMITDP